MPSITIRNVPAEVHRALRVRAALNGRSAEAEVRAILESATNPEGRTKVGSILTAIGHAAALSDEEANSFDNIRDRTPARPVNLE